MKYFWENIRGDMDLQAINTDYGIIPSEQEFNFETSFDFSSIMLIGSTSNAKRCMNDDGTICQVKTILRYNLYLKKSLKKNFSMKIMERIQSVQMIVPQKMVPAIEWPPHVTP